MPDVPPRQQLGALVAQLDKEYGVVEDTKPMFSVDSVDFVRGFMPMRLPHEVARGRHAMVTVLMTVYNAAEYLGTAIQSVLDQTYTDWELLIMDDGSPDPRVQDTIAQFSDERIVSVRFNTTVEQRRASVRYATLFNIGSSLTGGYYITYLAGDDAYKPDRLERMIAAGDEGKNEVVYGAQELKSDGPSYQFPYGGTSVRATLGVLDDACEKVDMNSVMHTRVSFERVGGWPTDPSYWRNADGQMWRRLNDAGYKFHPVPGEPTDTKRYRNEGVDCKIIRGEVPWA